MIKKKKHSDESSTIHNAYKDYSALIDETAFDMEDKTISYHKHVIKDQDLVPETSDSHVTFEMIPCRESLDLIKYLEYKITKHYKGSSPMSPTTLQWYEKQYRLLMSFLNDVRKEHVFFTPEAKFTQKVFSKIHYNNVKTVGRLYNTNSIVSFPREIRYKLFTRFYRDFDLSNAHPNFMFNYAKKNKIPLNGTFELFINDRQAVVDNVFKELQGFSENPLEKTDVKGIVLRYFYRTWDAATDNRLGQSKTLMLLDKDFTVTRKHLWESFDSNIDSLKKRLLEPYSLSAEKKRKTLKDPDKEFTYRDSHSILQSFYCQTLETEALKNFSAFIRNKYDLHLESAGKKRLGEVIENLNKGVDIPAIHSLILIPFFDGFYIYSPDKKFNVKISQFVEEFNELPENEGSIFVEKRHENVVKYITDTEEYRKVSIVLSWLREEDTSRFLTPFIYLLREKKPDLFAPAEVPKAVLKGTVEEETKFISEHLSLVREQTSYIFDVILSLGNFHNGEDVSRMVLEYIIEGEKKEPND